jgi:F-type H+-transporting ATPase subunit alpha
MAEAEQSLRKAVADIPTEVRERFNTDAELSDEDRKTVLEFAQKALARFQPGTKSETKPEAETSPETETEEKSGSEAQKMIEGETRS